MTSLWHREAGGPGVSSLFAVLILAKIVDDDVKCGEEGVHVEHGSVPFPLGSGSKPTLERGHLPLKCLTDNSHQAFNDNGVTKNFGSTESDYMTDVLNTESQQFSQDSGTAGKPFFLYLSPKNPRLPSIPAPRYGNAFNGEPARGLPSYNEEIVSDKPPWISSLPKISSTDAAAIQQRHENRVESLQAVDKAVKDIADKLSATGQLSNTYIVFTSDNGW
jgi:hypothetical protein